MTKPGQTEIWIAQAKRGNRYALAKLLASCDPWLRARTQTRLDDALRKRVDADDILQDAYLDAVCDFDQFLGCSYASFRSWLSRLVDHKLIDARRAAHARMRDIAREVRAGRISTDSCWNLLDQLYAQALAPSRVIRQEEALAALLDSLSELPESHREVLRLRYLEELTVAQVAARLRRSEDAVVALSQRAFHALRQCMDRRGEFTRGA